MQEVWGSNPTGRVTGKSIPSLWTDNRPAIKGLRPPEHHAGHSILIKRLLQVKEKQHLCFDFILYSNFLLYRWELYWRENHSILIKRLLRVNKNMLARSGYCRSTIAYTYIYIYIYTYICVISLSLYIYIYIYILCTPAAAPSKGGG